MHEYISAFRTTWRVIFCFPSSINGCFWDKFRSKSVLTSDRKILTASVIDSVGDLVSAPDRESLIVASSSQRSFNSLWVRIFGPDIHSVGCLVRRNDLKYRRIPQHKWVYCCLWCFQREANNMVVVDPEFLIFLRYPEQETTRDSLGDPVDRLLVINWVRRNFGLVFPVGLSICSLWPPEDSRLGYQI